MPYVPEGITGYDDDDDDDEDCDSAAVYFYYSVSSYFITDMDN